MAVRGRKAHDVLPDKPKERMPIYLMKKNDLRTGMVVKLRSGQKYIVLMNTGLKGEEENVLFCNGKWLSLDWFDDDMCALDRCDPFGGLIMWPGCEKHCFDYDIVTVYGIRSVPDISGALRNEDYVLYRRVKAYDDV